MSKRYTSKNAFNHPFIPDGCYREHRYVMMEILGRVLTSEEVVHHLDRDKFNNDPDNLLICATKAEHRRVHRREDAEAATGNPDAYKCHYCKQYDILPNMKMVGGRDQAVHVECRRLYNRRYYYKV